jgi:glycosyltransferase involved in cell wall biosynthesis
MKIAINLLPFRKKLAGAGKYAHKIVWELSKIDTFNNYYLFVTQEGKQNFEISAANFHFVLAKFNPNAFVYRILWEQFIFPFKLKKLKPDIVFTPSVAVPFFYKGKFFTTIHDLSYKKIKYKYSFLRRIYIEAVTKIAVKKSSIIFTVSNFSKKEIENEFGFKNDKIVVTYNGVDEIFFKEYTLNEISDFKKKYNLPEDFILYVGAIEPGKNLDKLLIAFSELILKYNFKINLALTSGVGWDNQSLLDLMQDLNLKERIIFLPYIPENELPVLYKSSKMLAYLSSYEGFGIPVLEALASGTPVITSTSEAIMEFSNKVVYHVNPENISEIVNGMYEIITNKDSIFSRIITGKKEAEKFKWSIPAAKIYNQINIFK